MIENSILVIILALALIYMGRKLYKKIRSKGTGCGSGCSCPSSDKPNAKATCTQLHDIKMDLLD